MKEKKGMAVLNWILILIIGAVIIIFGIIIASKTGEVEQKKQELDF